MVAPAVRVLGLCAGIGGLELGVKLAIPGARLVGAVERDSYAAACLVARMEEEALDQAPIWDDIDTFDGRPWCGAVDLITAGFPCQPWSTAGKGGKTKDERWLWPSIARVVGEVEPNFVFLENVTGIINGGLEHVLGDLADLGFDAEWARLGAADIGGSQRRYRLWILAYRNGHRLPSIRFQPTGNRNSQSGDDFDGSGTDVGHSPESGLEGGDCPRSSRISGSSYPSAVWPPLQGDAERWEKSSGPEPAICRMADGPPHRVERLHKLGNSVIPLVAATALIRLAERAEVIP